MKISTKAQRYYDMFEIIKRQADGEEIAIIKNEYKQEKHSKLHEVIRKYHGDYFPCDWIYATFHDLLGTIADYEMEITTIDDLEGVRHEIVDNQVDIYTHVIKQWLIDYPRADEFMSEAIASRSYSTDDGMWQVYSYAQYLAIDDIMTAVINLLQSK